MHGAAERDDQPAFSEPLRISDDETPETGLSARDDEPLALRLTAHDDEPVEPLPGERLEPGLAGKSERPRARSRWSMWSTTHCS